MRPAASAWACLFFAVVALAWVGSRLVGLGVAGVVPVARPAPAPTLITPIYTPEESLALFRIDPAFRIQLAAAEPMVEAPVAMTFDEDGRAWVVEMRGYMPDVEGSNELEPNGRVVVLTDTDGDGVFDRRGVFLEHLVLPRAVMPCFGGALVIAPPDLLFAKDTDGDGAADQRVTFATGLGGLDNPEHAPNGLLYGLDNWVHLSQHDKEYRFDGRTLVARATPGHGQWGLTQDDAGRLYYSPNPEALRGDLYAKHYAARNPALSDPAGINRLVSPDQTVWPAIPTPAVNRGYMANILRPDGTLASHTAACGPTIYRESLLPGCRGDAFVCEPAAYLVRRLGLTETPGGPVARNRYERGEFLASSDERFRPVWACVGPDGAVYVVDMHRGVIQHKKFITPYLKDRTAERGLALPLNMGRILRVTPAGRAAPNPSPRYSAMPDADLVARLSHTDGWHRQTAQRLLVERRATGVQGALREVARTGPPLGRLHALWTLEGTGALSPGDVRAALEDTDPVVRAAGVRLSEAWLGGDAALRDAVRALAGDPDPGVRLQVALSLGVNAGGPDDADLLAFARIVESSGGQSAVRSAVLSSVAGSEAALLEVACGRDWDAAPAWRAMAVELIDCGLRSAKPSARAAAVETLCRALAGDTHKGGVLLERLRRALHLDRERPRPLALSREPGGWAEACRSGPLSHLASACDPYLTWPGRLAAAKVTVRPLTPDEQALFDRGRSLFATCSGCHGPEGAGTPGQIPPLAGSARTEGPMRRLIPIILHGLVPPQRPGQPPQTVMPPAPFDDDEAIAAVLTFIRRSWGNAADPVRPEDVAHVRGQYPDRIDPWTEAELDAIP
jgi:mono/diheme cytochrome c family protein/glucose/arabinose dehydrogenase